jgi:hypothetical protein
MRDARRAKPALRRVPAVERVLQRVTAAGLQPRPSTVVTARPWACTARVRHAQLRHPVDLHRARAAVALVAALLGSDEVELVAQHLEQGVVRRRGDLHRLAVDRHRQQQVGHDPASIARAPPPVQAPPSRDPVRKLADRRHFGPSSPSGLAAVTNVARRPAVIRSAPDVALATQPAPYARRTCARAQRNAARSLASVFSASFVSAAVLSTAVLACATERGKGWDRPAPAPAAPELSLILLGEVGFPGRIAGHTAAELGRTLAARRRAGVPVVLLWLGDVLGDDCDPAVALARPGVRELVRVARSHEAAGGPSFAVLGVHEWRCGAPEP